MTDKESGSKEYDSSNDLRYFSLKNYFCDLGVSEEPAQDWAKSITAFFGVGPEWGTRWLPEKREAIITILQEDPIRLCFSGKGAEIGVENASISWKNNGKLINCQIDKIGQLVLLTAKNETISLSKGPLDHQVKILITGTTL